MQREGEGDGKSIAFLHELPALALEVVGHAVREQLVGLLLQEGAASPTVRPGNGTPCRVAEFSCWKVVRLLGCTDWPTEMKDDRGTMSPFAARTWYLE